MTPDFVKDNIIREIARQISDSIKTEDDLKDMLARIKNERFSGMWSKTFIDDTDETKEFSERTLGMALGFGVDPRVIELCERNGVRHPFLKENSLNEVCPNELALAVSLAMHHYEVDLRHFGQLIVGVSMFMANLFKIDPDCFADVPPVNINAN